MNIPAIPTAYNGVNFRSRLEARWAAMFDLLAWPWEYEPFDLKGYIPDFLLKFDHAPIIAEVKPVASVGEFAPYEAELQSVGWDKEIIILGSSIWPSDSWGDGLTPGWLSEIVSDGIYSWDEAVFTGCCGFGFAHSIQSYRCRSCGRYDGGHIQVASYDAILSRWRQAGNAVQWKSRH